MAILRLSGWKNPVAAAAMKQAGEKSSPGDRVVGAIDEGALRRSALMCYGLPLLALFIGAFCGSALAGETGAILGAICGLFSSWLLLRYALRRHTPDQRSQPFIRS